MKNKKHFDALDGIRGIAIILVFLTHMNEQFIVQALPNYLQPLIDSILSSGLWGVSWLFLLSGFLMAYLYKNPDSNFIYKRYVRIFPLFITMSFIMWIFYLLPDLNAFIKLLIILPIAYITNFIWKKIQTLTTVQFQKNVFYGFVILQLLVGLTYKFVIMRQPAVWFQTLPFGLTEIFTFLTNATLTLPLGNYIPMLDGVYWTLVAEVLFYILYPYLFAPIANKIFEIKRIYQVIFFMLLFFFFAGLHLLFLDTHGLSMLQIQYFYYFAVGIAIGYIAHNKESISKHLFLFSHPVSLFIMLWISYFIYKIGYGLNEVYLVMLMSIPLGISLLSMLYRKNNYAKFLTSPKIVFLGIISYSIYLSHTGVIKILEQFISPDNLLNTVMIFLIAPIFIVGIAYYLHKLLEKPYFEYKSKFKELPANKIDIKLIYTVLVGFLILFGAVFFIYQSDSNLLSKEYIFDKSIIVDPIINPDKKYISLYENKKMNMEFTARENNMGIISIYLKYAHRDKIGTDNPKTKLIINMKEKGTENWYSTSSYVPAEIGDTKIHPFGFPLIPDAKGKTYILNLYLQDKNENIDIIVKNQGDVIKTVHQINKSELFKNPQEMIALLKNKILTAVSDENAQLITLHVTPFMLFMLIVTFKPTLLERKKIN